MFLHESWCDYIRIGGRMNGSRMDGRAMFMERTKQDQVDGLSSLDSPSNKNIISFEIFWMISYS